MIPIDDAEAEVDEDQEAVDDTEGNAHQDTNSPRRVEMESPRRGNPRRVKPRYQIPVIPLALQEAVVKMFHAPPLFGHGGITKTLATLKKKVYFPKMKSVVERVVKACLSC